MVSWNRSFLLLAVGLVILFSLCLTQGCGSKSEKLAIGREAPNFTYLDLDGKTRELKELRGDRKSVV